MLRLECGSTLGEKKRKRKEKYDVDTGLYTRFPGSQTNVNVCASSTNCSRFWKMFGLARVSLPSNILFLSLSLTLYCGKISCAIIGGIILVIFFLPQMKVSLTSCEGLCNKTETRTGQNAASSAAGPRHKTLLLADVCPANGRFTRMHIFSLARGTAVQLTSITCNCLLIQHISRGCGRIDVLHGHL